MLIGLPAAGKSTVGSLVADHLARSFIDLDDRITAVAGRSPAEVLAADGEPALRRLEERALAETLDTAGPAVIAAGGGVVLSASARHRLRHGPVVVWLDVALDALASRLAGTGRPVFGAADPVGGLVRLHRERLALYAVCADAIVTDDGSTPAPELAPLVMAAAAAVAPGPHVLTEIVDFGDERSYPVLVGRGAAGRLAAVVPPRARRVAVVTQDAVGLEVDPGVEHRVFTVEDGEEAKRLEVLGRLASELARWGLTRHDAVVSVGGGVVSDLAGFLAASYHRGVPVVHVATTLLGQIDAAIGGKCGVNLPEGKNLLGAFKQPAAVICEIDALATLPAPEFLSGMGELAKYHFLGGEHLDRLPLTERVAACVRIKADVVVDDETEGGRRAILNYGHTLAHAMETATDHRIRHGEAVAVGLLYAAEVARRLGRIDDDRVAEHHRVVAAYGLDATIPPELEPVELVELFTRDKKAIDGITFVLDGPAGVEPVVVDDRELLVAAMEAVR